MRERITITIMITIIFGTTFTWSVKITRFHVPSKVSHSAFLDCKYNLEGEELYDVTWYKDEQQFFRCRPDGEVVAYVIDGIKLDYLQNAILGSCSVTLMALTPKSSGMYKCEVSSEGPTFNTDSKSVYLEVIDVAPVIQTTQYPSTVPSNQNDADISSDLSRSGSSINGPSLQRFPSTLLHICVFSAQYIIIHHL